MASASSVQEFFVIRALWDCDGCDSTMGQAVDYRMMFIEMMMMMIMMEILMMLVEVDD